MSRQREARRGNGRALAGDDVRAQLLAPIPVTDRHVEAAGIRTAVLEGGEGPPIVLLHGPGEDAVNWRWILPGLVTGHRVVVPDLPAHGSSSVPEGRLTTEGVTTWLGELLDQTCPSPPVVVGHAIGGAIAARFAVDHGDQLERLVLVDSLGLARFRPSPKFLLAMFGFVTRPTERSYDRFMRQCAFDLDNLRDRIGQEWAPFASHNLTLARSPKAKAGGRLLRRVGLPRIPPEDLARITVPTTLIWGRHDRANRLRVAETASQRFGWPLHVIDDAADDPARDQPDAFLQALQSAIGGSQRSRTNRGRKP